MSRTSKPTASGPVCVLIYGRDPLLLTTRQSVLESAGLKVFATNNLSGAFELALGFRIAVLVLCHSLTLEQKSTALSLVQQQSPNTTIIGMTAYSLSTRKSGNQQRICAFDGPKQLIDAVRSALEADLHDGVGI